MYTPHQEDPIYLAWGIKESDVITKFEARQHGLVILCGHIVFG